MESKKSTKPSGGEQRANDTPAARYNRKMFRALKKELATNPELDIAAALPRYYSDKLKSFQREGLYLLYLIADEFD
jgi:hypothetical protein